MRSVVTLEVKLKIIKELEEEKSQKLVAEQFKVAKLMISDIWRDKEKIKKHVSLCANPQQFAKYHTLVCEPAFSELDKACSCSNVQKVPQLLDPSYKKRLYTSSLRCIQKVHKLGLSRQVLDGFTGFVCIMVSERFHYKASCFQLI